MPSADPHHHERIASLSEVERAFLHAILIDAPSPSVLPSISTSQNRPAPNCPPLRRSLNDDMLFSVPDGLIHEKQSNLSVPKSPKRPLVSKKPKDYRMHVGLWQAHEDGVTPKVLSRMASVSSDRNEDENDTKPQPKYDESQTDSSNLNTTTDNDDDVSRDTLGYEGGDENSMDSNRQLRDSQSNLSWDDDDDFSDHFDAWLVLKDEYAKEHGFDYLPDGTYVDESELSHNQFKIIGTSAQDQSSHPHVVSPPLLDSIMNFLPEVSARMRGSFASSWSPLLFLTTRFAVSWCTALTQSKLLDEIQLDP